MRQRALDRVQQWSSKDPKLPHAVTATAHLTEALLHDTDEKDRSHAVSDWALRAIYAMAFCRFVNGFVDRDIAKSAKRALLSSSSSTAQLRTPSESAVSVVERGRERERERTRGGESSMYAHAAAIGMPEGFVDLRHRATHDEMPGLWELRGMVGRGLEWLWEVWWCKEVVGEGGEEVFDTADAGEGTRQDENGEAVDEDLVARQTEAEAEVDVEVDDGLCVVCGKRKRDGGGEETREGEEGPEVMTYKERLQWNKRKRKRPKTAFGLFEGP